MVLMCKIVNVEQPDEEGNLPAVRDYHAINSVPTNVRVPKKIATPVRVEGKVWFANERSTYLSLSVPTGIHKPAFAAWIAYMNMAILIATFAVALFNASADNTSLYFAYFYALVSIGVLVSLAPFRRPSITHGRWSAGPRSMVTYCISIESR